MNYVMIRAQQMIVCADVTCPKRWPIVAYGCDVVAPYASIFVDGGAGAADAVCVVDVVDVRWRLHFDRCSLKAL